MGKIGAICPASSTWFFTCGAQAEGSKCSPWLSWPPGTPKKLKLECTEIYKTVKIGVDHKVSTPVPLKELLSAWFTIEGMPNMCNHGAIPCRCWLTNSSSLATSSGSGSHAHPFHPPNSRVWVASRHLMVKYVGHPILSPQYYYVNVGRIPRGYKENNGSDIWCVKTEVELST